MKRMCLYAMPLIICLMCLLCDGCARFSHAGNEVHDDVEMQQETPQETWTAAEPQKVSLEAGRGYNPQLDFAYDEHDNIEVDSDYINHLCAEVQSELEDMFGPAEFQVISENLEEGYTIEITYDSKIIDMSDEQEDQIHIYIKREFKDVSVSDIKICAR